MKQKRTLSKLEKLKSRSVINHLFNKANAIKNGPIVFLWDIVPNHDHVAVKVAVSVPKRRFKNAVDRNRLKRQLREAYRLNQESVYNLLHQSGHQIALFIIYRGAQPVGYKALQGKIIVILERLEEELRQTLAGDENKE